MAHDDIERLSDDELKQEVVRLRAEHRALTDHLASLSKIAGQRRRDKGGRRWDLGLGVFGTIGGIVTTALTPAGLLLAGLGVFSLYRSGLAYFSAAADDDDLAMQIDTVRTQMANNELRAEAAHLILLRRQSPP